MVNYLADLLGDPVELAVGRRSAEISLTGVEFIDENGGGPGVRLRKYQRSKQSK